MRTYRATPMPIDPSQPQLALLSRAFRKLGLPDETVLVVDDEPMICDLEARFLRLKGYEAIRYIQHAFCMIC
jgi:hypothetical protein